METRMGALKMRSISLGTGFLLSSISLLLATGPLWAQDEPAEPKESAKASAEDSSDAHAEEAAPEAPKKLPTVLLIPYQPIARQATPELAAQVTEALVKELSSAEDFKLKTLKAPQASDNSDKAAQVDMDLGRGELTRAFKRLTAAEKLMKKYRFDQAIRQYQKAMKYFDKAAPALEEVDVVAEAYVNLGVAAFRRGKEDLAQQALAEAVVLNPERTLDPREYPPLLLRVYDDIYRKTLSAPRGAIHVEAGVAGAEVFYDGKSVGATPVTLTDVPPGRHFVRVMKEGAGLWGQRIEVRGGETSEAHAGFGGNSKKANQGGGFVAVAAAIAANRVDMVVSDAAIALAKSKGADYVLFGGLRKGETSIPVNTFMAVVDSGVVLRMMDLDLDLDMLSVSIESFKLIQDISNNISKPGKDIGPGPHTLVRGVASEKKEGPAEVKVGPPVPRAGSSRVSGTSGRRLIGGDDGGRRAVIDTGNSSGGRRRSSLADEGNSLVDEDGPHETIADIDAPAEWYENVWVWVGAGAGTAVVVGGVTAGVIAYSMLRAPEGVEIQAEWPQQ